jgi:3-oxoacyl-[acyl-carrier protein] reductase
VHVTLTGPAHSRRVAIVTGAAAGIGRAEALALAQAGHDVALTAHRDAAGVEETARRCREVGARALVTPVDVALGDEIQRLVAKVTDTFGRLDVLVNNAGALGRDLNQPLVDLPEDVWHRMLDSHLTGTFLCIKHAAPVMIARGWGRIVNTASIHGRVGGRATLGHYGAAKAGVIALTRTAARELGGHGITVNVVSPGFVRTDQLEAVLGPERLRVLAGQVPLGRIADPAEVAAAVVFLTSEAASYVNGAVLDVHGGRMEYV